MALFNLGLEGDNAPINRQMKRARAMLTKQAVSDVSLPWWSRNPLIIWRVWQYRGMLDGRGTPVALIVTPTGRDTMLIHRAPTQAEPWWIMQGWRSGIVERVWTRQIRHWSTNRIEAGYSY